MGRPCLSALPATRNQLLDPDLTEKFALGPICYTNLDPFKIQEVQSMFRDGPIVF